jgi:NAD-dependent dihydropyrimidine dehydrogenase PreA subunit
LIVIDAERCDGCGTCVKVCPDGAIYLVDGVAMVDQALCRECEACIAACPWEAISYSCEAVKPRAEPERLPARRPEPEVIQVRTETAPLRAKVLPVVSAALVWAGRELLTYLTDYALDNLDRRTVSPGTRVEPRREVEAASRMGGGGRGGRQRRRRHRGG